MLHLEFNFRVVMIADIMLHLCLLFVTFQLSAGYVRDCRLEERSGSFTVNDGDYESASKKSLFVCQQECLQDLKCRAMYHLYNFCFIVYKDVLPKAYTSGSSRYFDKLCNHTHYNLAIRKIAQQQYPLSSNRWGAELAVDGLKANLSADGGQCAISGLYEQTAKWWVDLGDVLSIHHITIYYRTDGMTWDENNVYTSRFLGFHVYISNTTNRKDGHLCFRDTTYTRSTIPSMVDIICPVHGQYVIYYNERLPGTTYPSGYSSHAFNELCEVEVYGCSIPGYYGPDCSIPCPDTNCRYCHIETGVCQGCKPGYQGHQCELPCSPQYYGELCNQTCGNCSDGMTCDNVNGTCPNGCDVGVYGDKCKTPCPAGWHGKNCSLTCTNCDTCDRFTGICTSPCYKGWKGQHCKNACGPQYYGEQCMETCGNCSDGMTCNNVDGTCPNGCDVGVYGDKCKTPCPVGRHGKNCSLTCNNCYACDRFTGQCTSACYSGWKGQHCTNECDRRRYGHSCGADCGACLDYKQCHHTNGSCLQGCDSGFKGELCKTVCMVGYYGPNCTKECSLLCKRPRVCNHVTGHCSDGCVGGWKGLYCQEVEKITDNSVSSSLYGVLAALSVCVIVIAVLATYICMERRKHFGRQKEDRYNESKDSQAGAVNRSAASYRTDEHGRYEEMGELGPSTIYDTLQ